MIEHNLVDVIALLASIEARDETSALVDRIEARHVYFFTRRGAPTYTSFRKLYKRTRRRLTDMLERDHMSTKHGVSFLMQNAIWPRWPEVPH